MVVLSNKKFYERMVPSNKKLYDFTPNQGRKGEEHRGGRERWGFGENGRGRGDRGGELSPRFYWLSGWGQQ
jgi:hypothetical protein